MIARSLEGKGAEWDGDNNVEHLWEQVKRTIVESAREVCGLVRVGGKNPKTVWWNDEIKAAVRRRRLLGRAAGDLETKERCMEAYREEKRNVKKVYNSEQKESK